MTRQQANYQLVNLLHKLVEENPQLRLGQILQAYNYVEVLKMDIKHDSGAVEPFIYWNNEFYLEPQELLKRVEQKLYE